MRPNDIDDVLKRDFDVASDQDAQQAGVRVWSRLQTAGVLAPEARLDRAQPAGTSASRRKPRTRWSKIAAAAVLVLAAIGTAIVWRSADDPLVRVVEGDVLRGDPPSLLRSSGGTGTIRSNGGGGAVLALSDGSRIEMRSQSEIAVERGDDSIRIVLNRGGIIVNAAKQRAGRLYVLTKDITVSVVGTVFLVNAELNGSRVAVFEGEVRVLQGATEKKLLPGEQVSTSPAMDPRPMKESILWSRNAPALLSLLQQSTVVPPAIAPQTAAEPREAFEEVSIRPSAPAPIGGRGGGGGRGPEPARCTGPAVPLRVEIDPRRFAASRATLHALVMAAYGKNCPLVSGGPDWVSSDRYDIEAVIPENSVNYTVQQFRDGEAPKLQVMLQRMLAERFKLSVRREPKDVDVYNLVVIAEGKLTPADSSRVPPTTTAGPSRRGSANRPVPTISMRTNAKAFATVLTSLVGRPVVDRTGLTDLYDIHLTWDRPIFRGGGPVNETADSSIFSDIQQQLGLKLDPARVPMETIVIERVERPSEN